MVMSVNVFEALMRTYGTKTHLYPTRHFHIFCQKSCPPDPNYTNLVPFVETFPVAAALPVDEMKLEANSLSRLGR
jgi:hypothetical protein